MRQKDEHRFTQVKQWMDLTNTACSRSRLSGSTVQSFWYMVDVNFNPFHPRTLPRIRLGVSLLLYTHTVNVGGSPSGLAVTAEPYASLRICCTSLSVPKAHRCLDEIPLSLLGKCHSSSSPLGTYLPIITAAPKAILLCSDTKHIHSFNYQGKNHAGICVHK